MAGFAKHVDACAQNGGAASAAILNSAAAELANLALTLLRGFEQPDPAIGIYGGVFLHSNAVREGFIERIQSSLPAARVTLPIYPPEIGALCALFEEYGIPFYERIQRNILETYSEWTRRVIE